MRATVIWTCIILVQSTYSLTTFPPHMSCVYGPRGSLTAKCFNATSYYFKLTSYRFDYLDETLQCISCSLKSLEQGTFDIPGNEIKTLDIRNSSIEKIWPKAFIGMIYMEQLLLAHNPIEVVYPEAFLGVRKVKYLDMEDTVNHLEPKVFQDLYLLEVLILKNNKLQEIKAGTFDGLHNLRILDLSENALKHVNNSFDDLVNLKILKLRNNFIKTVYGDEFNHLKTLLLLNLESNNMYTFATNLGPENQLRTLSLANNFLNVKSFRPGTFNNLNFLEELDLSNNNFNNLTVKLFQGLFRLRILNLNDNGLTTINTGTFSGLPHLRVLNISRNNIHTLKVTGRFSLPSLMSLDVSNNNINDLDYMSLIMRVPSLKHIDLMFNRLSCKTISQLEALLESDEITYLISDIPESVSCPKLDKASASLLVKEFAEKLEYQYINNTLLIWMFILITIVILLIGVLFYVQFFIVFRMGERSYKNIRILSNLGIRRNEERV
ncbi:uncharacterized protein [Diabrotica undecimpunctata]|uniref:uncharacterized protein isoform X2 n=1 Tax=Diabrotica undecimpunctata TaxID=50387 RepID=UPI003B6428E1